MEMIARELLGVINLSGAQAFHIHEVTKVVVVCEDENLVFAIFWIVPSCLKDFDDSQKLTVVGLVPSFRKNDLPKKKDYWMPLAQIIFSDYPILSNSGKQLA